MLLNCYVGSVPGYRNAAAVAVTWGRRARSGIVSQARNFDMKIIKYRESVESHRASSGRRRRCRCMKLREFSLNHAVAAIDLWVCKNASVQVFLYRMDDWLFASFANCITSAFLLSLPLKRDELNSRAGILWRDANESRYYILGKLFISCYDVLRIFSNLFRMESYSLEILTMKR